MSAHLIEGLVMPTQAVFMQFKGHVFVGEFLYDHVDQDLMFEAMEEDERLLYGERSMIDDSDFEASFGDGWPEDDYCPEEHYTVEALLGSDL
jgi:hypothetical protein